MNAPRRTGAFTLIELLVVIGVIAVLIGLTMVTVRRARDAAGRTHCLANLHQIALYLQQYQTQYRGQIPIYITTAQMDRIVYHGGVNDFSNLGLLVPANIVSRTAIEPARVLYCPTLTSTGTFRQFNYVDPLNPASSNPWIGWPNYTTRVTYSLRMEYAAWDNGGLKIQYPSQRWNYQRCTASTIVVYFSKPYGVFPHACDFDRKTESAIVSDLTDIKPVNPRLAHRGAINVLYANWSAKTVPPEHVEQYLKNIETQNAANPNGGAPTLRAYFDLWQALDRY